MIEPDHCNDVAVVERALEDFRRAGTIAGVKGPIRDLAEQIVDRLDEARGECRSN